MNCRIIYKDNKIDHVQAENGERSILFDSLKDIFGAEKALELYALTEEDGYKQKIQEKVRSFVGVTEKQIDKLSEVIDAQETLNKLVETGLADNVYQMTSEEIEVKAKELDVDAKQVALPTNYKFTKKDNNRIFLKFDGREVGQIELLTPIKDSNNNTFVSVNIEIDPKYRNRGLSKYLYEEALKEAKNKGYSGLISIDGSLQSPEKSTKIRKYFNGAYSTDKTLLNQVNNSINESNKLIEEDNIRFDENEPLLPLETQVYLIEEQIQFQKSGITPITNGFIYKNDVYLNKNADESTMVHEFNHLYNNWLKQNRPEVYKKGLDLVKAELEKTANVSVKDRVRKKEVDVDDNGESIFEEIKDQEFNIEFPNGARAFGSIKDGVADLTQINAPKGVKGNKTYERVLFELNKAGVKSVRVTLQSGDSRKAIASLINKGILSNPRDLRGVSTDEYPTLFNISAEKISREVSEIQDIIDFVKTNQPNLEGEALQEEILTEMVGRRGLELLNEQKDKAKSSGIIDYLKQVWQEIKNMLGLSSYTDEQVLNMNLQDFANASAVDLLRGENFVGKDGQTNFEQWKGENTLVETTEIQDVKTGQPIVAKVYHGTTNEFYEFDSSVKGNIEGHLGKVNYFTSDYGDANENYLAEGADITGRIDRRAEEIESELESEYGHAILTPEELDEVISNFGLEEDFAEDDVKEIGKIIAEKELKGGTEQVLELFVKLNNPVVLGNGATWFDALEIDETYIEEATQEIVEEYGITEQEAKDEYDYEIRDRAVEKQGDSNKIVEALEEALDDNGYDSSLASDILGDNYYEAEVDLNKLEQNLRNAELYDNYDGELASSQVIADFFKKLGFDGIILTDVAQRFRNMGLGNSTSHIHVFDEFNSQIKLADGSNVTFGETSDIRYQVIGEKGASKIEEYSSKLNSAKELEKQGESIDEIANKTGWYKQNNQWKYLAPELLKQLTIKNYETNKVYKLQDILQNKDTLLQMYPEMADIKVVFYDNSLQDAPKETKNWGNSLGAYNAEKRVLGVNTNIRGVGRSITEVQRTLGHEFTHLIQGVEGFPVGGHKTSVIFEANRLLGIGIKANIGETFDAIESRDKSKFTKAQNKIIEDAKQTGYAIVNNDIAFLNKQYKQILGEIDANVIEDVMKKLQNGEQITIPYNQYLQIFAQENKIDLNNTYLLSNGDIQFSAPSEIKKPTSLKIEVKEVNGRLVVEPLVLSLIHI